MATAYVDFGLHWFVHARRLEECYVFVSGYPESQSLLLAALDDD